MIMSRWDEQFQGHAIHVTLKEAKNLIGTEFDDINAEEQSEKRRILKVLSAYEETLAQLDPELIPYNVLDTLNTAIRHQNIWNQLTAYSTNGSHGNLVKANNQITNNIIPLSQLLAIAKKSVAEEPIRGLEESLDTFAEAISTKKDSLEKEINEISTISEEHKKKLEELSNNINAKKTETDGLITSWQEQHSSAQHKRDTDFIADQKVRTDTYAEWRDEIETKTKSSVDTLISKSDEKLQESQVKFDEVISEYISTAEDKHKAILNLYELVAGDSVAGGYKKNADDEKSAADFWRWVTIIFILLTAGWTGYSYIIGSSIAPDGSLVIGQIVKGFAVTAVLLFGAVYSSQQSNTHRQNEKRTRWFALEVNAIDPFIASLNEEDRKALKNKLSERLFGQHDLGNEKETKVIDEHAFSILVKGITDIIRAK